MPRIYYRRNQYPLDDIHNHCMFVNNHCIIDVRARARVRVFIMEKITLIYILLNYTYKK